MYRISVIWLVLLLSGCVMVPDGETKNQKASRINVQLGIGYYNQGNIEIAKEKLVKALRQDPESSQAHHAYAVLQNRFLDKDKAELHFKKAVELDDENSEALNNYGAFLCNDKRYLEAEKMFVKAVENPLYRSPEVALTSAAVCLLDAGKEHTVKAKEYLLRALALGNNYRPALIKMSELTFNENDYKLSSLYLQRYHQVGAPTAQSLWLAIRNSLEQGEPEQASELGAKLTQAFPESKEYKSWLALQK